ncbi:MAG: PorV/PorQ family protein, partial [Bacteroidota bacterium]
MKNIYIPFIALLILATTFTSAFCESGGTKSAEFLKIGIGARAVAMGEAFTAVSGDADCMAWNPAGLATLKGTHIRAMHNQWFQDISLDYFGIAHSLNKFGTIGINGRYLWMDKMEITTLDSPKGTDEEFSVYDLAGSISYSKLITNKFALGLNLKFIKQSI